MSIHHESNSFCHRLPPIVTSNKRVHVSVVTRQKYTGEKRFYLRVRFTIRGTMNWGWGWGVVQLSAGVCRYVFVHFRRSNNVFVFVKVLKSSPIVLQTSFGRAVGWHISIEGGAPEPRTIPHSYFSFLRCRDAAAYKKPHHGCFKNNYVYSGFPVHIKNQEKSAGIASWNLV